MKIRFFQVTFVAMILAFGIHASSLAPKSALRDPLRHAQAPRIVTDSASGGPAHTSAIELMGQLPHGDLSPRCMYPPGPVFPVLFAKLTGDVARMTWQDQGDAYAHDIVRGSLTDLSATGGDFGVATKRCLTNDAHDLAFDDPDIPDAGDGYWYVLRTDQTDGCPGWGGGSYDDVSSRQVDDRDPGIEMSGFGCTCFYFCDGLCC